MRTPSNRTLCVLILAIALVVSGQARADESEWKAHMDTATAAYRAGDYRAAATHNEAALREAQSFDADDPRVAPTLDFLALLYEKQGRFAEAERLYRRLLGIREKALAWISTPVG